MPASGGEAVLLTDAGGWMASESADGKSLFYTKQFRCGPLFMRSLSGGPERQIVDAVCGFTVTGHGIYYLNEPGRGSEVTVRLLDPVTGSSREVRKSHGPLYTFFGFGVSPDGRSMLLAASAQTGADLYLVENFR
jgi:hypothetical protein